MIASRVGWLLMAICLAAVCVLAAPPSSTMRARRSSINSMDDTMDINNMNNMNNMNLNELEAIYGSPSELRAAAMDELLELERLRQLEAAGAVSLDDLEAQRIMQQQQLMRARIADIVAADQLNAAAAYDDQLQQQQQQSQSQAGQLSDDDYLMMLMQQEQQQSQPIMSRQQQQQQQQPSRVQRRAVPRDIIAGESMMSDSSDFEGAEYDDDDTEHSSRTGEEQRSSAMSLEEMRAERVRQLRDMRRVQEHRDRLARMYATASPSRRTSSLADLEASMAAASDFEGAEYDGEAIVDHQDDDEEEEERGIDEEKEKEEKEMAYARRSRQMPSLERMVGERRAREMRDMSQRILRSGLTPEQRERLARIYARASNAPMSSSPASSLASSVRRSLINPTAGDDDYYTDESQQQGQQQAASLMGEMSNEEESLAMDAGLMMDVEGMAARYGGKVERDDTVIEGDERGAGRGIVSFERIMSPAALQGEGMRAISIPRWNPNLGTLEAIDIDLNAGTHASTAYANMAEKSVPLKMEAGALFTLSRPIDADSGEQLHDDSLGDEMGGHRREQSSSSMMSSPMLLPLMSVRPMHRMKYEAAPGKVSLMPIIKAEKSRTLTLGDVARDAPVSKVMAAGQQVAPFIGRGLMTLLLDTLPIAAARAPTADSSSIGVRMLSLLSGANVTVSYHFRDAASAPAASIVAHPVAPAAIMRSPANPNVEMLNTKHASLAIHKPSSAAIYGTSAIRRRTTTASSNDGALSESDKIRSLLASPALLSDSLAVLEAAATNTRPIRLRHSATRGAQ